MESGEAGSVASLELRRGVASCALPEQVGIVTKAEKGDRQSGQLSSRRCVKQGWHTEQWWQGKRITFFGSS